MGWRLGALLLLKGASATDNGLGLTPPMGWRSWNLYGANVNQSLMISTMDGMVRRDRQVDGVPTSLCDLGYCDVGLDDNWQLCGSYGDQAFTYHNLDGKPVVNEALFPDMKSMTDYAHSLGLTAGWYHNNCICSDHCGDGKVHSEDSGEACYKGDVGALVESYDYDSVKLDGCGAQMDLDLWESDIRATGKAIMIENCHWGHTVPHYRSKDDPTGETGELWCPFNFYRSSMDVRASYASVIHNLLTTVPLAARNLSVPGCWAYPDMLEVGCDHGPGGDLDRGLSVAETRSHFGSWCIVSSPLTLSLDVNNATIMDAAWPVIANPEAIAVNQAWAGHSGGPFLTSQSGRSVPLSFGSPRGAAEAGVTLEGATVSIKEGASDNAVARVSFSVPDWQYFSKPMEGGDKIAVLLMNYRNDATNLTLSLADVPGLEVVCGGGGGGGGDGNASPACVVRDVWKRSDVGSFPFSSGIYETSLEAHDAAFITISAGTGDIAK